MDKLIQWVVNNKEWIFSGAGLMLVTWIGRVIYKGRQADSSQTIRSGNNSINIQAGRDMQIKNEPKRNNVEKK